MSWLWAFLGARACWWRKELSDGSLKADEIRGNVGPLQRWTDRREEWRAAIMEQF